ncbi:ethylene-responsive transcription factor crf1 [Hordeum vulgare]|nr:ethylene-responsive transcription factor crf1 [Hordeum vulgare]
MNFTDIKTHQRAQDLTCPSRLVTEENPVRRLLIAEADENAMVAWSEHFPQDIDLENELWTQRRAERVARREDKRARKELVEAQIDNPEASS